MDRGAWRATVHGVSKSRTWVKRLSTHVNTSSLWKPLHFLLCQHYWVLSSVDLQFQSIDTSGLLFLKLKAMVCNTSHFVGLYVASSCLGSWYFSSCCCCCCQVASVVSDSVRSHRRQPTRLHRPWDSPGKNHVSGDCWSFTGAAWLEWDLFCKATASGLVLQALQARRTKSPHRKDRWFEGSVVVLLGLGLQGISGHLSSIHSVHWVLQPTTANLTP